jgi:transposase
MTKWPTEKHFASWLGLCPNHKISGGQILSSRSRKVVNKASTAFRMAAFGASRSNTATGAFYRRLKSRVGAPKAITATAHKIARHYYICLKTQKNYIDSGAEYYEQKYREKVVELLKKKAKEFGFKLESAS